MFSFYIIQSDLKCNDLNFISNKSNPYLVKFNYHKTNSKYFSIYDKTNEISHFCPFQPFLSHFACYISKNGKLKTLLTNKKRFNWLKIDITDLDDINDMFDFAFLPHKFNNFYQVCQKSNQINNFKEEFQNIIFQFRPNGHFLNPEKYFDFTLDFLLFYDENKNLLLDSPVFNRFIDIVINELSEMNQYFELTVVSYCDKKRKIVPPLEVSRIPIYEPDKAKQLCDTAIIFHGNLFLLWAFNANLEFDLFLFLFKKWNNSKEMKFDVSDIFEIILCKFQSNDFSNQSARKYLEFVNLYIQENQINEVERFISENQKKISKSILKLINAIILHPDEQKQDNRLLTARIDQKDYDYQNFNNNLNSNNSNNDNNNSNDSQNNNNNDNGTVNDDQSYITHINEHRGLWFKSIPNYYLYQRKEDDKSSYIPPFTFRLFESKQSKGSSSIQKKRTVSNRPTQSVISSFGAKCLSTERKYKSSRPNHNPANPT